MHLYYDPYGGGAAALVAFYAIFVVVLLVIAVAGYVVSSLFFMKLFEKAGVEGKWRAWVPVYNTLIFAKLGDVSPWVLLGAYAVGAVLGNIPFLGFVFSLVPVAVLLMAAWRVGLKSNKEWPYLLLWILGIGYYIWLGIVAYSKDRWNPAIAPAPWAGNFLADKTVWQGVPAQNAGYAAPAPAGYGAPGAYTPPAATEVPPAAPTAPPTAPPAAPTAPPVAPPAPPATDGPDAPRV